MSKESSYYQRLRQYESLVSQREANDPSFDSAELERIKEPLIKGLRRCMIYVGTVIVDRKKKNKNDPNVIGLKAHMDKLKLLYEKVTTEQPIQEADYLDTYYQLPFGMRLAGSPLTLVFLFGILAYLVISNFKRFTWKLDILDILGAIALLICMSIVDKVDTKITKRIKEKMGDNWRNHRFFFVVLHLLISGIRLFAGLCLFSVIRGEIPQYFSYFKLVLAITTAVFMASMLIVSICFFFKALFGEGRDSSDEYRTLMRKAFLTLFYFAAGAAALVLEFKFLI